MSSQGSAKDQALVLLHEKVHQFFVAKLYILREYRVTNRVGSYVRSSLPRYIEEALAETIAQVGVNGFKQVRGGVARLLRTALTRAECALVRSGSSVYFARSNQRRCISAASGHRAASFVRHSFVLSAFARL